MVVDVDGDVAAPPDNLIDLGEFSFGLINSPLIDLIAQARTAFARASAALALALDENLPATSQRVGSVSYLMETDTNRPIFTLTFSVSGRATSSRALSQAVAKNTASYISGVAEEKNLDSVIRLLSQSLDDEADTLYSFLTAWTALEIFVNKEFRTYQQEWEPDLRDRFKVIATVLNPTTGQADTDLFKQIKDTRDKFYHAMKIEPAALPAEGARRLLRKYFRLHLDRPRG